MECSLPRVLLLLTLLVGVNVVVGVEESPSTGKAEHGEHVKETHYAEDGEHNDAYDHQSILGSEEEANQFATLSPEEAKERLGGLMDKMDADHDKVITKDELTDWIQLSYINMDIDEAKESVETHDTNKDGKVSWSEYYGKMQGDMPEKDPEDGNFEDSFQTDKMKFDAADVDGDQALSLEEYAAFLYPYDFKHMHEVEIDVTLREMDADKDGTINFKEFLGEVSSADEADQLENRKQFSDYDADGDGRLSRDEMRGWLVPDSDETARDEAEHLMEETDSDGDGALSKEEILAKHELWVGSSATAYERALHTEL